MVVMKVFFSIPLALLLSVAANAGTRTWDGRYDTSRINLRLVYFVPSDGTPLKDWRDRFDYFARRISLFHLREFGQQSTLRVQIHPEPLISRLTTKQLRQGNGDAIFFRTLRESNERLKFGQERSEGFPILLVLSEINWRPLDDFYRVAQKDGQQVFEGNYQNGQHFPGAASGGSRAAYLAQEGVGWGLVSADGWRVPYRGSDCVIYHEGCGHTVGLPHPEPGNDSVMSLGQYRGWINESWLDKDQKLKLGWMPEELETNSNMELFNAFRALVSPVEPKPGEPVRLRFDWPSNARIQSLKIRYQTSLRDEWKEVSGDWTGPAPAEVPLTVFEKPTPVSYRVEAELMNGAEVELWGYFQVRSNRSNNPLPSARTED